MPTRRRLATTAVAAFVLAGSLAAQALVIVRPPGLSAAADDEIDRLVTVARARGVVVTDRGRAGTARDSFPAVRRALGELGRLRAGAPAVVLSFAPIALVDGRTTRTGGAEWAIQLARTPCTTGDACWRGDRIAGSDLARPTAQPLLLIGALDGALQRDGTVRRAGVCSAPGDPALVALLSCPDERGTSAVDRALRFARPLRLLLAEDRLTWSQIVAALPMVTTLDGGVPGALLALAGPGLAALDPLLRTRSEGGRLRASMAAIRPTVAWAPGTERPSARRNVPSEPANVPRFHGTIEGRYGDGAGIEVVARRAGDLLVLDTRWGTLDTLDLFGTNRLRARTDPLLLARLVGGRGTARPAVLLLRHTLVGDRRLAWLAPLTEAERRGPVDAAAVRASAERQLRALAAAIPAGATTCPRLGTGGALAGPLADDFCDWVRGASAIEASPIAIAEATVVGGSVVAATGTIRVRYGNAFGQPRERVASFALRGQVSAAGVLEWREIEPTAKFW